ncbi:MAG: LamG-like jellyroll fold domain-containing protein [bacterium]
MICERFVYSDKESYPRTFNEKSNTTSFYCSNFIIGGSTMTKLHFSFLKAMLICLVCTYSASAQYQPDANTVLLFHFNESGGSTILDASSNANNATAVGTSIVSGKYGMARSVTKRGDKIIVPNIAFTTNAVTFEAWVYLNAYPDNLDGGNGILHKFTGSRYNSVVCMVWGDGRIAWMSAQDGSTVFSTHPFPLMKWTRLTCSWDGNTAKIYFDEVQETSVQLSATMNSDVTDLVIADYFGSNPLNGVIDEVRISNIARIPNQNHPPVITLVSPASLWPPNHKYVTFKTADFVYSVVDADGGNIDKSNVYITSVSSDEAENVPGDADGNTINDILIAENCKSVQVRAERIENGNGRVYNISLAVKDASGNLGNASYKVSVNASRNVSAIEDGAMYVQNSIPNPFASSEVNSNPFPVKSMLETGETPKEFKVANYPNPFNPSTIISFDLPKEGLVKLIVYNSLGQEIARLVDSYRTVGTHRASFNAANLASGVYYYSLVTSEFCVTNKMLLLR